MLEIEGKRFLTKLKKHKTVKVCESFLSTEFTFESLKLTFGTMGQPRYDLCLHYYVILQIKQRLPLLKIPTPPNKVESIQNVSALLSET